MKSPFVNYDILDAGKVAVLSIAVLAWTGGVAVTAFAFGGENFLARITQERMDIQWDPRSLVKGDFDDDRKVDEALVGYSKNGLVLAIHMADGASKIQYLEFGIGQEQAAICAVPAHLSSVPLSCATEVGKLPGCVAAPQTSGLILEGGDCDPINLYWDHVSHRLTWWRN
jgi:hypothetical protein